MKSSVFANIILLSFTGILYSQWTQVSAVNNIGAYPSISIADCNTVVVSGGTSNSPVIYRSTNGGENFSNITTGEISFQLFCVWAVNKDTIFAGDGGGPGGTGGNAKVYRTINGGINWSVVLTTGGNSGFINGIVFQRPAQNFGIIVSDPPIASDSFWIAVTTDMGSSWNITRAPQSAPFSAQNSVFVVDNSFYGYGLSGTPARFMMTTDGGISWQSRILGLPGNSVTSVAFHSNKLNGIAVTNNAFPVIAVTTNGGNNWQTSQISGGLNGFGILKWVENSSIYYICADSIKRTSNSGASWEKMNTPGVNNFAHMDLISTGVNSICAYALASDGKILKYEGEPFGINEISGIIPSDFRLFQNYPNPFNPVTHFRFYIPLLKKRDSEGGRGVFVDIRIYDAAGKEILVLVNRHLYPGTYEAEWDASGYPSGVYYYSLKSGGYSSTKKMVLVK